MENSTRLRLHTREQAAQMEQRVGLLRSELDKLNGSDIRSIIGFQVAAKWVNVARVAAWLLGATSILAAALDGRWALALTCIVALPFVMIVSGRLAGLLAYSLVVKELSEREHDELREAVVVFAYFGTPGLRRLRAAIKAIPAEVSCASMGRHLPQCRHTAVV